MDKKAAMFKLIEQWKTSGVTRGVFAQQHGVKRPTFDYWYNKYVGEESSETDFIEISAEATKASNESHPRIELVLSGGIHIKIY
jgi:hypothetical protein